MDVLRRKRITVQQHPPFDVAQLEGEIGRALNEQSIRHTSLPPPPPYQPRDLDQPIPQPPLMIEQPMVSAEDLGRITAEAIKTAHESAAKSLDDLGKEIAERVNRIEQIKAQSLQQIDDCKELARQHRDAGNLMSMQVESASADLTEARDLIDAMRKKIKVGG